MQILCVFFAVIFLAFPAYGEGIPSYEEQIATLPPEMMYDGKPINPGCVYAANPFFDSEGKLQDLRTCKAEPWRTEVGSKAVKWNEQDPLSNYFGYDFYPEDKLEGISGGFSYRYLGKVNDGLALLLFFSGGGSGHFSLISIFKREKDVFSLVRNASKMGDRCLEGIADARVVNGKIEYSYAVNSSNFYKMYKAKDSKLNIFKLSHPIDCMALIHKTSDAAESIELIRNEQKLDKDLPCVSFTYREQVKAHGTKMTPEEARAFFKKVEKACAAHDDLK